MSVVRGYHSVGQSDGKAAEMVRTLIVLAILLSAYVLIVDWSALTAMWRRLGPGLWS